MQGKQKTVSATAAQSLKAIKPPADLWEVLEREYEASKRRPDGAFTIMEYAARFNLSHSTALHRINKLVADGTVKELGRFGQGRLKAFVLA